MDGTQDYPSLYLAGILHFNACDYFEAHETWEELWSEEQGPAKRFYQGLIQVAVALHHFGNGNIRGARKLNVGCRQYLNDYQPQYQGLDVSGLLATLDACFVEVMASRDEFPQIELDAERLPELQLDPPPREWPELPPPDAEDD